MGKYRVYEIAKELGTDTKTVMDMLASRHYEVKSQLSAVDDNVRQQVMEAYRNKGKETAKPVARPNPPAEKPQEAQVAAKPADASQTAPKVMQVKGGDGNVFLRQGGEGKKPTIIIRRPGSSPNRPRPNNPQQPVNKPKPQPAAPVPPVAPTTPATPVAKEKVTTPTPATPVVTPEKPQVTPVAPKPQETPKTTVPSQPANQVQPKPEPRPQQPAPAPQQQGNQARPAVQNQHQQPPRPNQQQRNFPPRQNQPQDNRNFGNRPPRPQQGQQQGGGQQGQRPNQGFKKPFGQGQGGKNFGKPGGFQKDRFGKDDDKDYNNNRNHQGKGGGKKQDKPKNATGFSAFTGNKDNNRRLKNIEYDKQQNQAQGTYAPKGKVQYRTNNAPMGRKNKQHNVNKPVQEKPAVEIVRPSSVQMGESITLIDFAKLIKREPNEIIKKLFSEYKMMININGELDFDTAQMVGIDFDVDVQQRPPEEDPTEIPEVEDDPAKRVLRPPVVTVMGHVDHGKTSLLDAIRQTNVTSHEAGGITQHIGAYKVTCNGSPIVFLDTPGHEAFTAMRARGAQVTDIAVLVVAADDGVMPQTIEAINHAKDAQVPIIVAINKIDRPNANPEHVMAQLAEHGLQSEEWGGEVIMVPVSAHKKTGINELLENILLVAEVAELKANPNLPAHGTIIEARLDKGRGPVATVLVERGTLNVGDTILAGTAFGKVRAMMNDRGEKVKSAGPATPVEVLGLNDVPMAGDKLDATEEHIARSIAQKRIAKKKSDQVQKQSKVSLEDLFERIKEGELKELNIVVKADVQGSIEALRQSLEAIKNDEVKVSVVHAGVGIINESDVMLASASNALIIGFNVRPDANARKAAEAEKVDIRTYRVIYDALNDVEAAIKGMLAPKFKETIIGHVEIRQLITISKNVIAGCYVLDGKVTNNAKVRLLRDGTVVHEGVIESLRRFKDDVKEVKEGFECGITLENYRDVKEGDQIEAFIMEKVTDL